MEKYHDYALRNQHYNFNASCFNMRLDRNKFIISKTGVMIHQSWKHLSEDEINARLSDNLVFFYGEIVKYLHPNIKPWQEAILVHADRGLMKTWSYSKARAFYHNKIKKNLKK